MKTMLKMTAMAALVSISGAALAGGPSNADVKKILQNSFSEKGQAKLDRLDQSTLQDLCSNYDKDPKV